MARELLFKALFIGLDGYLEIRARGGGKNEGYMAIQGANEMANAMAILMVIQSG